MKFLHGRFLSEVALWQSIAFEELAPVTCERTLKFTLAFRRSHRLSYVDKGQDASGSIRKQRAGTIPVARVQIMDKCGILVNLREVLFC